MVVPAPISRVGMHDRGRMNRDPGPGVDGDAAEPHHQLRFRDDAVAEVGGAVGPRQAGPARAERHHEPQPIARHDPQSELRVVHAAQEGAIGAGRLVHQQHGRHLCQGLDHEHPRHQRLAGKVSLEEVLVHRDVLERHDATTGLELGHRIHQRRRIAVTETLDDLRYVQRHGFAIDAELLLLGSSGRRRLRLRVQPLHDFSRDVQAGIGPHRAGIRDADDHVQALLLGDHVDDRVEPGLEVVLQIVGQLLLLGLRVLFARTGARASSCRCPSPSGARA